MFSVKFNNKEFEKILKNSINYSYGFFDGIELNRLEFNRVLGGYVAEIFGEYVDSKARMNSDSLHHVYEWGKVGQRSGRLFSINVSATKSSIMLNGKFLPSKSASDSSNVPFTNKAEIMENKIAITVTPTSSDVLAFEDNGEMVFTVDSIYIANPGGDEVAGSFGRAVEEFFDRYLTSSVLDKILFDLQSPEEFSRYFSQGAKQGKTVGVMAGRKYFSMRGAGIDESI